MTIVLKLSKKIIKSREINMNKIVNEKGITLIALIITIIILIILAAIAFRTLTRREWTNKENRRCKKST